MVKRLAGAVVLGVAVITTPALITALVEVVFKVAPVAGLAVRLLLQM
jgi:hypothetical protein